MAHWLQLLVLIIAIPISSFYNGDLNCVCAIWAWFVYDVCVMCNVCVTCVMRVWAHHSFLLSSILSFWSNQRDKGQRSSIYHHDANKEGSDSMWPTPRLKPPSQALSPPTQSGNKANRTLCSTTQLFTWLYTVWQWSSLAYSCDHCYVQVGRAWSSGIRCTCWILSAELSIVSPLARMCCVELTTLSCFGKEVLP